jgi:hypothetical protein
MLQTYKIFQSGKIISSDTEYPFEHTSKKNVVTNTDDERSTHAPMGKRTERVVSNSTNSPSYTH